MTSRRLWQDESGMVLGLAVIVVVLIGVLAAGFLALVRNDLEATILANRGQRALTLADAGAQAAVARLRADPDPAHYDGDPAENAVWAHVAPTGSAPGKVLTLDEGSATVEIRYLLPAEDKDQTGEADHAPERVPPGNDDYPDKDFFAVVSEATSGDTRRKVEVIVWANSSGSPAIEQWSWREVYR